jgi:hypothetical protein
LDFVRRVVGVISALVIVGVAAPATASEPLPRFVSVRVCSYPHFSLTQRRCTKDERGLTVVSNRFVCSFTVIAPRAGIVSMFWAYQGVGLTPIAVHHYAGTTTGIYTKLDTGGALPEPGGAYTCHLSAESARAAAAIKSGGPTGALVDAAVCLGAHARRVRSDRSFPVCQHDESSQPIAAASAASTVVCNAVYPNATTATIELLHAGAVVGDVLTFRTSEPLNQGFLERPSPGASQPLEPGLYTCRFTASSRHGPETVEKTFSVVQP